ncbi:MAG: CoA-binding protein [Bacteroidetes bacterium QS_9_68_14]|nr:MAG: CoA-binding protein [Bacteroidetes bacterium QS_9_68_14]
MPDLKPILSDAQTIAVVGCSGREDRTSHKIARYLQDNGYRVVPVNPNYDEVLGEPCYPDLQHVPADTRIDVVNVFRRREHTADMVRDALQRAQSTDAQPAVWTQLGVSSDEARDLAEEGGLPYVKNRCIMVEHGRLFPEAA